MRGFITQTWLSMWREGLLRGQEGLLRRTFSTRLMISRKVVVQSMRSTGGYSYQRASKNTRWASIKKLLYLYNILCTSVWLMFGNKIYILTIISWYLENFIDFSYCNIKFTYDTDIGLQLQLRSVNLTSYLYSFKGGSRCGLSECCFYWFYHKYFMIFLVCPSW